MSLKEIERKTLNRSEMDFDSVISNERLLYILLINNSVYKTQKQVINYLLMTDITFPGEGSPLNTLIN